MNFLNKVIKNIIIKKDFYKNNILKFGIDSTNFTIHFGHLFLINFIFFLIKKKIKIIIIIGDFTALIKKKKFLKKIILNSICLKSQLFNLLGEIKIFFNSIWLNKIKINFFIKLINIFKFNKHFNKTIKNKIKNLKIIKTELIYPIFQSLDSVLLKNDIELGGSDQILNIICGKKLQKIFLQKKQCGITLKIININNKKISKTNNNFYIINENFSKLNLIFFNIKNYITIFKKKKDFLNNFLKLKIKKKKKFFYYFYKKNFLSYYFKKIFNYNKFIFYNLIYKKIFSFNNVIIKNFFIKKFFFNFKHINNYYLIIYE